MSRANAIYKRAWELLQQRIAGKTGWGKNEIAAAMAECLQQAVNEVADA